MQIVYTPKFLRLMNKLKDKRSKEDTEKVIKKIESAKDFLELNNLLDIKKYVIGGYRIRYSGRPEMRIRFSFISDSKGGPKDILELRWVGTREDYDKELKTIHESNIKKMRVVVTESQFQRLILKNHQ